MKRLIILSLSFLTFFSLAAQELKVNTVELLPNDDYAVTHPRLDANENTCAVLKVYFNQDAFGQLQFESPLMLGDADFNAGYYAVYVANGIKNLTLRHNACSPVTVNFKDYDVSIERGKTYKVEVNALGLKNTHTVVFNMLPLSGYIDIDGRKEKVENGALQIELAPGIYEYKAYDGHDYYASKEGIFDVSETAIGETKVISLKLEPKMTKVQFSCNVKDAVLYVDNEEYGKPGEKVLPLGEHEVHVVGEKHKDYIKKRTIGKEKLVSWDIKLKPNIYVPVSVEGHGYFLFVDNKRVLGWSNGKTVMLKPGKHLFMVSETKNGRKRRSTTPKKIRVEYNTTSIDVNIGQTEVRAYPEDYNGPKLVSPLFERDLTNAISN